MTVRAQPVFTVKEFASGVPWIEIEYLKSEPGMPPGLFGFDLPQGTTLAEAKRIADVLQDKLTHFAYTP